MDTKDPFNLGQLRLAQFSTADSLKAHKRNVGAASQLTSLVLWSVRLCSGAAGKKYGAAFNGIVRSLNPRYYEGGEVCANKQIRSLFHASQI